MAFINEALIQGAAVLIRQVSSATTTTAGPTSSPPTSTPFSSAPAPSTSLAPSLTTSAPPNQSSDPGNGMNNNNTSTSQSSPLLFFVALGFGVVFTNLWIIVGVKYCFRYNARSRQMRLTEDGEPITLENMPRPHRRRREKKLMTMDEVNEKFPMMKYKNWVASRAKEGLPTQGGVSAPPSRAASLRSVEGVVPELPPKESVSEERPATSATATKEKAEEGTSGSAARAADASAAGQDSSAVTFSEAPLPKAPLERASDEHDHTDEDEDDEHINAALPPDCLTAPGDTCAICIDTIEDDDDVRGLTCGHAFHAVCLDPWLTSRRACCPLCKADYYTPKPRPPAPEGVEGGTGVIAVTLAADGRHRMNMPVRPQTTWIGIRGNGRMFSGRLASRGDEERAHGRANGQATATTASSRRFPFFGRTQPTATSPRQASARSPTTQAPSPAPASPTGNAATASTGRNWFGGLASGIPRINPLRRQNSQSQPQSDPPMVAGANPAVTPSQLEAGVRTESR